MNSIVSLEIWPTYSIYLPRWLKYFVLSERHLLGLTIHAVSNPLIRRGSDTTQKLHHDPSFAWNEARGHEAKSEHGGTDSPGKGGPGQPKLPIKSYNEGQPHPRKPQVGKPGVLGRFALDL